MDERARCPNGCGETMRRVNERIALQYHSYGSLDRPLVHDGFYVCSGCQRTYVSSVFKRFKEKDIVV